MIYISQEDYTTDKKFIKETKLIGEKWVEVETDLDSLVEHNGKLIKYRRFLELSNGDSVEYLNPLTGKSISRREWKDTGSKIEDLL